MVLVDERPLSERLRSKCADLEMTLEQASLEMGQGKNAASRWVNLTVIPGPEKFAAIAEFLGISVYEVGGAVAADQVTRHQSRLPR